MRQSAFALLGDLAKTCAEHLRPVLLQFAGMAVANLEATMITPQSMPACNNACWSLGAPLRPAACLLVVVVVQGRMCDCEHIWSRTMLWHRGLHPWHHVQAGLCACFLRRCTWAVVVASADVSAAAR